MIKNLLQRAGRHLASFDSGQNKNLKRLPARIIVTMTVAFCAVWLFQNCAGDKFQASTSASETGVFTITSDFQLLSQPQSAVAFVGESITLRVSVHALSAIAFEWYKDTILISGANSSQLTLSPLARSNSGNYYVIARSNGASLQSNVAVVEVRDPPPMDVAPSFTLQPQSGVANVGDVVVLRTAASGFPTPTLKWFHNGSEIVGETATTLELRNVQAAQAGSYSASATNRAGMATSVTAQLQVNAPPPPTAVFAAQVQPIVEAKCLNCHQPGGLAFSILTSNQFAARSATIKTKLNHQGGIPFMPPSYVDNSGACDDFQLNGDVSATEKATILSWLDNRALVNQGVPVGIEGNITLTPPPKVSLNNEANVRSLTMPSAYTMPAGSVADEYRCFVLPSIDAATKFVTGYEIEPGNPAIVHHAILGYPATPADQTNAEAKQGQDGRPGYQCFGGLGVEAKNILIWAPGRNTQMFPVNTGLSVPGGRKLILQIHYNKAGASAYTDQSTVRLKTADSVLAPAEWLTLGGIEGSGPLPAGQTSVLRTITDTVGQGKIQYNYMTIYGYFPHMHTYGRRIKAEVTSPTPQCLVNIPNWDFHFQLSYFPNRPVTLQTGDQIKTTCDFDTTSTTSPVRPGENSTDEMCYNFFYVSRVSPASQTFSTTVIGSSGTTQQKTVEMRLTFSAEHIGRKGFIFISASKGSVIVFLHPSPPLSPWVAPNLVPPQPEFQTVASIPASLDFLLFSNYNITAFSGARITVGYGIGADVATAYSDMVQSGRTQEAYVVP